MSPKHSPYLLPPRLLRHLNHFIDRNRRRTPLHHQRLQYLGRQIGQPDHPPDIAFRDPFLPCNVLQGGSLPLLQLPPPLPGTRNGAQHMRVLAMAARQPRILGRQDLWPPISLAQGQRNHHSDALATLALDREAKVHICIKITQNYIY